MKGKKKKHAMGDDPLLWIKEETIETNIPVSSKNKPSKVSRQKKKSQSKPAGKTPALENGDIRKEEHIVLEPVLVIDNVKILYEKFNFVIQKKSNVIIDASAIKMIDTAMLQLLIAFVRKLQSQGVKILWSKPSDELLSRAKLLNLKEHLGID